jgi:hypothetical protein
MGQSKRKQTQLHYKVKDLTLIYRQKETTAHQCLRMHNIN